MATSNRERIGAALEIVSAGLDPFIERAVGDTLSPGTDWTALLDSDDRREGSADHHDVRKKLRLLSAQSVDGRDPLDGLLSPSEKSFASELLDTHTAWDEGKSFTGDDTYRALDTAERLLRAAGAVGEADRIRTMRVDVQRREFASEVDRTTRAHTAAAGVASDGLPAWRDVLTPHPDVAAGRYATSEFAADLHQVAFGDNAAENAANEEYRNPVEFFQRTYLTGGLRELLATTADALAGDPAANSVINLQTNFGGGKTHSMLAVWHLAAGRPVTDYPQDVQELLADSDMSSWAGKVSRVALVGNEIPPNLPIRTDGDVEVNTLWGELAWQLGGREAYNTIADADHSGTNPGAALKKLLADHAPCVILIDEWVAYARGLYTRNDLRGGTFDTQFTFAQVLSETVAATPGAVLLVSIPSSDARADDEQRDASDLEIGGPHGREALQKLQNAIGRTAHEWSSATSQESFEIVRRRLFTEPGGDTRATIAMVAKKFVEFYRSHHGEFPRETADSDYEKRITNAYPIHPELFDRLYEDWSSLERFQRTRGVLRLMSAAVHALSESDDPSPLIMPGSMPLDAGGVRNEVSKYLEDNWTPILDADVDAEGSTPARIDRDRPIFGKRSLTRRIARSLFLGSAATLRSANKGIERHRLFLGVAQPGDTTGNFGSALQMLLDGATYLYNDGERYWYDTQPSLNRKASEHAEGLAAEDVWAEIITRLQQEKPHADRFAGLDIAPTSTGEVGEPDGVRLVLLHPRHTHSGKGSDTDGYRFAAELMTQRGNAPRERRNMILALGPDTQRYAELDSAVRQNLAWRNLASRVTELDLTQANVALVHRRTDETNRAVAQRIPATYIWLYYPAQDDGAKPLVTKTLKIDGPEPRLAVRTAARLVKEQMLLTEIGVANIRLALDQRLRQIWNNGRISVGELWQLYLRYPYLNRLQGRAVLDEAVRAALYEIDWENSGFALATGYREDTGDFTGLVLPGAAASFGRIDDSTLLVAPRLALKQHERDTAAAAAAAAAEKEQGSGGGAAPGTSSYPNGGGATGGEPGTAGAGDGTASAASGGGGTGAGGAGTGVGAAPAAVPNARYRARLSVDASRDIAAQLRDAADEVLANLADADPDSLDITVTVEAERIAGFDESTVRTVTENGTTLGFSGNRFEDA